MKNNFNLRLREIMDKQGLNQEQLASIVGVRQSQVSNWLNQKSVPGYASIRVICSKLGVKSDWLLDIE